jgi:hypothetical protein
MLSRRRRLQIQRVHFAPAHSSMYAISPLRLPKLKRCRPTTKQLLSEPYQISVDHVGLAVVGYLLDAALSADVGDNGAVCSDSFTKKPHNSIYLMKRRACLRVGRREDIAEIQRVFGIAIEIASGDQPRRDTISQHRQIDTRAVRDVPSSDWRSAQQTFRSAPFSDRSPICGAPRAFTCHEPSFFFVITAPKQRIG